MPAHLADPDHNPSFTKSVFLGEIREDLVFPFPVLAKEEQENLAAILDSFNAWAAANVDSHQQDRDGKFPETVIKGMTELGMMGVNIAEEYGGFGASAMTFNRVFAAVGAVDPALCVFFGAHQSIGAKGISLFGTDEQKKRWLPRVASGELIAAFCLTESGSGSDAQAMRTSAVPSADGSHYVLNGQKIWISSAHIAKWGLFLVRTDPTAIERGAKHEGITALIIDMEADGVECRPIRDITGEKMFNEVFFTDARMPVKYRLGDDGAGWQVAMGTLGHERVGTAGLAITMKADLESMVSLARAVNPDALRDPELRERIARAHTDIEYTRLLNYRALSKILKGEPNWPEVPLAKLQWSHLAQTLAELACDLLGPQAILAKGGADAVDGGAWNRLYVFQRYTSIGAGTTEVQKNIISDKAIKLPRAR
jgi:alkylation response protein AidB-like acyl-CoA dehydrogenase